MLEHVDEHDRLELPRMSLEIRPGVVDQFYLWRYVLFAGFDLLATDVYAAVIDVAFTLEEVKEVPEPAANFEYLSVLVTGEKLLNGGSIESRVALELIVVNQMNIAEVRADVPLVQLVSKGER